MCVAVSRRRIMSKCVLTHRGWFLEFPVYVGNLDTDCPVFEPRRPWLA